MSERAAFALGFLPTFALAIASFWYGMRHLKRSGTDADDLKSIVGLCAFIFFLALSGVVGSVVLASLCGEPTRKETTQGRPEDAGRLHGTGAPVRFPPHDAGEGR